VRVTILTLTLAVLVAGCGAGVNESENARSKAPDIARGEAAVVGSDSISVADIDGLLHEAAVSFGKLGRPFPAQGTPYYLDLRDEAVRYLVERSALLQEAKRLGAHVEEVDLERELSRVDRKTFLEERQRSGLTIARVRQDVHDSLLTVALFQAVVSRKAVGESNVEAMNNWERHLASLVESAKYAPEFRPSKKPRSPIPPELAALPKGKGPCDLKQGTFTIRQVAAHGCMGTIGVGIPGIDGPGCGEIPIDDFATAGLAAPDTAYGDYEETLMDTAPSCVPYPSTTYTITTGEGPCFGGPQPGDSTPTTCKRTIISAN
jgi:hypothetical protein